MADFVTTEDILNSINNKPKLPMQTLGMPGPAHVMGLAKNIAQGVPPYLSDIYERMKRAVTQGPYSSPSGSYDPSIGTLPFEIMSPGYGRAMGLGSSGSKLGTLAKPGFWNQERVAFLKNLDQKYEGVKGRVKLINKDFRERYPEYNASDAQITNQLYRIRNWGGVNAPTGAGSTTELGAFGGQGRLNTPSYGESMGWLQEQRPVDRQWVEDWAKNADIPIKRIKEVGPEGGKTTYIELQPKNPPAAGQTNPKVRIPGDEKGHLGVKFNPGEPGNLFDAGYGLNFPSGEPMKISPKHEPLVVNQAGMPYANREALDAALKLRTSQAPFGGNWLVPPDMAPRLPPKPTQIPTNAYNPYQDPNQLKLLSTGFTPVDLLKVLQQNEQRTQ